MTVEKINPHETIWCDRGFFPSYYGFCPSRKAWAKSLRKMNIPLADNPYPHQDACVTTFERPKTNREVVGLTQLMTVSEAFDKVNDPLAVCGLFVHEAMHVWRHIRLDMGEVNPSTEFEAYAIQMIFQQLMHAYQLTRNWSP